MRFRFIILTKKSVFCMGVALMLLIAGSLFAIGASAGAGRQVPIYCVKDENKRIAISFDAAWGADDTDQLINILNEYSIKATFFVVGDWVDKYPSEVKRLSDSGHAIENHSNSHPYMTKISTDKMISELTACNEKIAKITGKTPTLFRCPYGDYNNAVIESVNSMNMYTIQWDVDSRDWMEGHTAEIITNDVVNNVKDGSIVLFHNDAKNTPAALPKILDQLLDKGYTFELISDLIYKENYNIDHAGMQIPN